jgi:hypothetical protein
MPPAVISAFLYFNTITGLLASKKWVQVSLTKLVIVGTLIAQILQSRRGDFRLLANFSVTISIFLFST